MSSFYALEYPSPLPREIRSFSANLMVYRFLLDPAVDSYNLILDRSAGGGGQPGLIQWKDNPGEMITDLIMRDLKNSGIFTLVVDQFSNARYRYALEGVIRTLKGAIRNGKALGLIEAEVTLVDFEAPFGADKNLLRKVYRAEAPAKDSSGPAVVAALNEATKSFSGTLRGDILAALQKQLSGRSDM